MPPMLGPVISHSRSLGPSATVIGDEPLALAGQRFLDHRMAAAFDLEAGLVGQVRQAPAAFRGAGGVARGNVDPGDRVGGRGDARGGGDGEAGQLLEMGGLGGERVGAGLDHSARLGMEVGRIEADHAGQRLAMGEARIRRHQPVGVPGADLDMIAEHRIVADLERRNAGCLAVARLQRGDCAAAVAAGRPQRVERSIISLGDIAALGSIERRRVDQRGAKPVGQRGMAAKIGQQRGQQVGPVGLALRARP